MSTLNTQATVGELVAEQPSRARVFEKHGIDFCCGGKLPLEEACERKSIPVDTVVRDLAEADALPAQAGSEDYRTMPLSDLIDHIVDTHHAYLVREMPRLSAMTAKVAEVHGERHRELKQVAEVYEALREELENHMMKEERILFPAIRMIESSGGRASVPFGTIGNPIAMMEYEHDNAGHALSTIRDLTKDYAVPEDACNTYRVMLHSLSELERDLHLHIHKENNILFPRALEAERGG